jgi:tetratricopeptide (TPR) repeat protein
MVTAVLAFATLVGGARAATYDDFAQAVNFFIRGDWENAVKGFTAVLKAGDLAPAYVFAAHRSRAKIYLQYGRCSEALEDLNAAAGVQPLDKESYLLRADARLCLKDAAAAQQDIDTALGTVADSDILFAVARQQWSRGYFRDARGNLDKAVETMKADKNRDVYSRYIGLWQVMTADRLGALDRTKLEELIDFLDSSDWPMPLFDFYRGKRKVEEVVAKAARDDSGDAAGQKCETDFYLAEWHIARGDVAAAKPLIASALAGCPVGFVERWAAKAEAERLGIKGDAK